VQPVIDNGPVWSAADWFARIAWTAFLSHRRAWAGGVVLLALGILLPGATRELALRMVGGFAILAGATMWIPRRNRSGRRDRVGAGTKSRPWSTPTVLRS
jgi:hypothetical protein